MRIRHIDVDWNACCPVCEEWFTGRGTVLGNEAPVYCSDRCAFFELRMREDNALIAEMDGRPAG